MAKSIEMYLKHTSNCNGESVYTWSMDKDDSERIVKEALFQLPDGFEVVECIDGKKHVYDLRDLEDGELVGGWRCCQIITHIEAPCVVSGNTCHRLKCT
jgi:hypothetical protein